MKKNNNKPQRKKEAETWNTCPDCGKRWKDEIATPQLLHRTTLCDQCAIPTAEEEVGQTRQSTIEEPVLVKLSGQLIGKRYWCIRCDDEIIGFRDRESAIECVRTGFCQKCQDKTQSRR